MGAVAWHSATSEVVAEAAMNQRILIRRTVTPGNVPAAGSLEVGELAAGLADSPARMWIGVPTSIVPSGVLELFSGTAVEDAPDDQVYGRSNGDWVHVVLASPTAPINVPVKSFWFNTTDGSLNLFHDDGTSEQWVEIAAGRVGPQGPRGLPGPQGDPGPPGEPGQGGSEMGVTDGSDAAPGEIGECLVVDTTFSPEMINNNQYDVPIATLGVPPGDWDVTAIVRYTFGAPAGTVGTVYFMSTYLSRSDSGDRMGEQQFNFASNDRTSGGIPLQTWAFALPPTRLSTADGATVIARVGVSFSAITSCFAIARIQARRMR